MSSDVKIDTLVARAADLEEDALLARGEFGQATIVADAAHLAWKYLENPDGAAIRCTARVAGRLIGHVAVMPRRFELGARTLQGGVLVDLLVDKEFRSPAALLGLVEGIVGQQLRRFDFLVTVPNATGIRVWRQIARFGCFGDLSAVILPARPVSCLLPGGWLDVVEASFARWCSRSHAAGCGWSTISDHDRPEAWDPLSAFGPGRLRGQRSGSWIDWRFKRCPGRTYSLQGRHRQDQISDLVVSRLISQGGRSVDMILDVLCGGNDCCPESMEIGCQSLRSAWNNGASYAFYLGSVQPALRLPFIPLAQRYLPQPVPVMAKALSGAVGERDLGALALTMADFDMF